MLSILSFLLSAHAESPQTDIGYRVSIQSFAPNTSPWSIQQSIRLKTRVTWDELYVQATFGDARVWGSEITHVIGKDDLANLYEGYIHIPLANDTHSLQIGRQEFVLNNGRYLWTGAWNPYGRTLDGVVYNGQSGETTWQVSGFVWKNAAEYTEICAAEAVDCTDRTVESNGDFLTLANAEHQFNKVTIQPYVFYLSQDPTDSNLDQHRRVISPGLRIFNKAKSPFFYDFEGTIQTGQASETVRHFAWSAVAKLGVNISSTQLAMYYEENSGDGDATDDVDNNFEGLIGKYHGLRGWADQVGGINSRDISLQVQQSINDEWQAHLQAHVFQLSNPNGGWYGFNQKLVAMTADGNTSNDLAKEIDAVLLQKPYPGLSIKYGYSVFLPDTVATDLRSDEIMHFPYIWLVLDK